MTPKVVAFFNNKGGVGKTSLAYHLAWMFASLGVRVLAADLDPQSNLTAAFLDELEMEEIWPDGPHPDTIQGAIDPLRIGVGDVRTPTVRVVDQGRVDGAIGLLQGDMLLTRFEDDLSHQWNQAMSGDERAFRVLSAFWRVMVLGAETSRSSLVLVDVGPNLGALNRAALVAADHVVIPLAPDLFSLQGLRNLGPALIKWRGEWGQRLALRPAPVVLSLPKGSMNPLGYVVLQHGVRFNRPVRAYDRWMARIPGEYSQAILEQPGPSQVSIEDDPHCLGTLKHFHSLVPMAQEARKPLFMLEAADGAIGAHLYAVQRASEDFEALARRISDAAGGVIGEASQHPYQNGN